MPDYADVKRLAQAVAVIGKIRLAVLEPWMEMTESNETGSKELKSTLEALASHLFTLMPEVSGTSNLSRHISFNMKADYHDIIFNDLPIIESALASWAERLPQQATRHFGFEELLHSLIAKHCLPLYAGNHYRDAVWNAYLHLFAEIRRRTSRQDDGSNLVEAVFSLKNPLLVLGDLNTETGRNQQKGFIQLLQGVYQAYRNPLAHSGGMDLGVSAKGAAQHMILASVLLRWVDRAKSPLG